jgi:putative transposase
MVQRPRSCRERSKKSLVRGRESYFKRALEAEVEEHLGQYQQLRDEGGHQVVVRNGHAPRRLVWTGVGPVAVRRPRIDERAAKGKEGHQIFTSAILPKFLRRSPSLEGGLATLYLCRLPRSGLRKPEELPIYLS